MKSVDVNPSIYIAFNNENNKEGPKFKVGDHVKILKCKSIFTKGYALNWPEDVFVTKKVKNTVTLAYVIRDLNREEILGAFYDKKMQKTNQKEFRNKDKRRQTICLMEMIK